MTFHLKRAITHTSPQRPLSSFLRSTGRGYWVSCSVPHDYRLSKHIPLLLTEYMALTIRDAVDTLPESSSKLWVSLFMVSTLMSGLPSVTPRRPRRKTSLRLNIAGHTYIQAGLFSQATGALCPEKTYRSFNNKLLDRPCIYRCYLMKCTTSESINNVWTELLYVWIQEVSTWRI